MGKTTVTKSIVHNRKRSQGKVRVTKNGPYLVSGSIPLSEQDIIVDRDEQCHGWKEGKKYPAQEVYSLCRCGHSHDKPFCDGSHVKTKFNGVEKANNKPYKEQAIEINGPDLKLTDAKNYCVRARFCHRGGGTWELTKKSDNPEAKQMAIEEARECPSGRLVAWEKDGNVIEPKFEPSIGLVMDTQAKKMGPIWVRGGIPVFSSKGKKYETRKKVTLCRCGKSSNKPFCDGAHLD
jgi:CDGSH-type Zn-finger protein